MWGAERPDGGGFAGAVRPEEPKTSPWRMSKERSWKATRLSNCLLKPRTQSAGASIVLSGDANPSELTKRSPLEVDEAVLALSPKPRCSATSRATPLSGGRASPKYRHFTPPGWRGAPDHRCLHSDYGEHAVLPQHPGAVPEDPLAFDRGGLTGRMHELPVSPQTGGRRRHRAAGAPVRDQRPCVHLIRPRSVVP